MHNHVSVSTPRIRRAGRLSISLLLLISALTLLLLSGCRANPNEQARIAKLKPGFDNLAATVDEMQREHALQQERIAAAQEELAKLREQALPGVPRAAVAPPTRTTGLPVTATPPPVARDAARDAAGSRFLRNFAILCFIGFLVVQGAKIMKKRREGTSTPPEPGPAVTGPGATVFHPPPTDSAPADSDVTPDADSDAVLEPAPPTTEPSPSSPSVAVYNAPAATESEGTISFRDKQADAIEETPAVESEPSPDMFEEEAATPPEPENTTEQPSKVLPPGLTDVAPRGPQGKQPPPGRKEKRRHR